MNIHNVIDYKIVIEIKLFTRLKYFISDKETENVI